MTTPGGNTPPSRPAGFSSPVRGSSAVDRAAAAMAKLVAGSKAYADNMERAAKSAERAARAKKGGLGPLGQQAIANIGSTAPATGDRPLGGGAEIPTRPSWNEDFRPLTRQEAEDKYREIGAFSSNAAPRRALGGGAEMPPPPPPGGGDNGGGGALVPRPSATLVANGGGARIGGMVGPVIEGELIGGGTVQPYSRTPGSTIDGSVQVENGGARGGYEGMRGAGAFMAATRRTQTFVNSDYLANRTAMASGGGYNKQNGGDRNLELTRDAYIDDADRQAGVMQLQNLGGFTMDSTQMGTLGAAARTASLLNPMLGFAGAARVETGNLAPNYFNQMRMMTGVETMTPGGTPRGSASIVRDTVRQITGREGPLSSEEVAATMGIGGQTRLQFQQAGATEEQINTYADIMRQSAQQGSWLTDEDMANRDIESRDTMVQAQRERTTAEQAMVNALVEPMSEAFISANRAITTATEATANILREHLPVIRETLGTALGYSGALTQGGGSLANAMGTATLTGALGLGAGLGSARWFGRPGGGAGGRGAGGRGGGGRGGGGRGGGPGGGGRGGVGGGLRGMGGRLLGGVGALSGMNWLGNEMQDRWGVDEDDNAVQSTAKRFGKLAWDTLEGGVAGLATAGLWGGVAGAVGGFGTSANSWRSNGGNYGRAETGDGPGKNATGKPAQKIVDLMAKSGIPHRITNVSGGAGPGSYHASGEAVDIAGAVPGDQENLLAINRFLAKSLGSKAAELIYTGPGGQNIHDGKPKASWGGAIDAKHKDHVHIAVRGGGATKVAGSGGAPAGETGAGPGKGRLVGKRTNLNADFVRRLEQFAAAVGRDLIIGSGWRDRKQQAVLYDRWLRRVPGQAKAAPPGKSNHEFGLAVDIDNGGRMPGGGWWRDQRPERFGLRFPMSFEAWHIEPENAKAMRGGASIAPGDSAGGGEDTATASAASSGGRNLWAEALSRAVTGGAVGAAAAAAGGHGLGGSGGWGGVLSAAGETVARAAGGAVSAVKGAVSGVAGAVKGLFGDDDNYDVKELAALARSVGFKGQDTLEAVGVALAESGGKASAVSPPNKDKWGSRDKGLWQINDHWHPDVKNPLDPKENAKAAYRISSGGRNWSPWTTWKTGAAQRKMADASKKLSTAELGDGPGLPARALERPHWAGLRGAEVGDGPGWADLRAGAPGKPPRWAGIRLAEIGDGPSWTSLRAGKVGKAPRWTEMRGAEIGDGPGWTEVRGGEVAERPSWVGLRKAEIGDGPGWPSLPAGGVAPRPSWGGVRGAEIGEGPGWTGVRGGEVGEASSPAAREAGSTVNISKGGGVHIAKVEVNLTTPQVSQAEAQRIGKMVVEQIAQQARMKELSR